MTLGPTRQYRAFLMPRDGSEVAILALPFTSLTWERISNQPSEASVVLGGLTGEWNEEVCEIVAAIDTWAYELGIYRNGERVWCGPVTAIDDTDSGSTVTAHDVAAWLGERFIHFTHVWTDVEAGQVMAEIVADAMNPDLVPGLTLSWDPTGVTTTRTVKANQYRVALAEIGDLTAAGIHWTTVDRTITVSDYDLTRPSVAALGDPHFIGRPNVNIAGPMGTRWTVRGTPDEEHPTAHTAIGTAVSYGSEAHWGIHEKSVIDTRIKTDKEATQAAKVNLKLMSKPSVMFSGGALHASAPLEVNDLIPGALFDLSLNQTCRPVNGRYRLTRVVGTHGADTSTIEIECEPLGEPESQSDA